MTEDDLVTIITNFYFESGDFNGYPARNILPKFESLEQLRKTLTSLIKESKIEITAGINFTNPHIKAYPSPAIEVQLKWLNDSRMLEQICIYPHNMVLQRSDYLKKFAHEPYRLNVAQGSAQFEFKVFDISVLEYYRNDPRYKYITDFVSGSIVIDNEYYEAENVSPHDKIILQTFGFAYDDELNRYVAVYLRYLMNLSPEHQKIWAAKEVYPKAFLHPDYYNMTLLGNYGTKISIFKAFIKELKIINEICALIGKPNLFRDTFSDNNLVDFGFLLRPTLKEFNQFILLFDNMLSGNINKEFFTGDIDTKAEFVRKDGKIEVKEKGTIQLLKEYLDKTFKPANTEEKNDVDSAISAMKTIRTLRQSPAHSIKEDTFDQKYFRQQRNIVIDGYKAVRMIRLIFSIHPAARKAPPKIDRLLFEGKIWDI